MPPLVMKLVFDRIEKAPVPFLLRPLLRPISRGIAKRVKAGLIEPNLARIHAREPYRRALERGGEFSILR
jgi:hypothetical protein